MINRDNERINIKNDPKLGVIPCTDKYWSDNYNGVSASFVQKCMLEEGIPPAPSGRERKAAEIRARIIEDPKASTAPFSYFIEEYDTSRYNVGRAFKDGGIVRAKSNFHPTEYILPWRTGLIDSWKRPPGIDAHLEALCD